MKKFYTIVLLFCFYSVFGQPGKEAMKVTDMLKIKQLNSVTINPGATDVAFVVNSIEPDPENKWESKYLNQIFLAKLDEPAVIKPYTFKENASQPVWSPDGKQLAFVRQVDNKPQIFILSLSGGEPFQLTKFKYGATGPKWSPDGNQILFSSSIGLRELLKDSLLNPKKSIPNWPYEKPGFDSNQQFNPNNAKPDPDGNASEIRAYLENNVADKKAKVFNKINIQEESTTNAEISFNHYFLVPISNGNQITEITHGFFRYYSADFTPDGKQLIVTANLDSTQHPDRALESSIYIFNLDGSEPRKLLGEKNMQYSNLKISPSGKWLAFQYGNTSFVDIPQLAILSLQSNKKEIQTFPFDRNKGGFVWSADEQWIYFTAPSNGGQPLYRIHISDKKVQALTDFNSGILSFDFSNNKIVFVKTEVSNPSELFVSDMDLKSSHRISNFNEQWVSTKSLSIPEKYSYVNDKGLSIEYWVMKPMNYEIGKKYPAILDIHGGPSAMWGPGELSMWHEFQYYTSKGYVVIYGNPRGSGGYGAKFLQSNKNDWGNGPCTDVLTYLDKAVALGFIDSSKLTITGGSYAGYLVAWIISHDQRFKAACSQRGVYDLSTFFGEGKAWRLVPNYFGGYPWEPSIKNILERESPINYVQNIKTPYLIFHGENDLRTGVIQSEMIYRSLKMLERPVEYVRHPGATHELTRSGNNRQRIDQMLRTMEFFERYIQH